MDFSINNMKRKAGETDKQYYQRMRSENVKQRGYFALLHPAHLGTYRKPETKTPQFERKNTLKRDKPLSKFIGFRKVRQWIESLNMTVWVKS